MSDITEYLNLIKNARYGREVRGAIHDAIEACYEDGKSGATDLTARQQINNLRYEVDDLTDSFGELSDEVTELINSKTVVFDSSSSVTVQNVYDAFMSGAICLMKAGETLYLLSSVSQQKATFYRVESGDAIQSIQSYSRTTADNYWKFRRESIPKEYTAGTGIDITNNQISAKNLVSQAELASAENTLNNSINGLIKSVDVNVPSKMYVSVTSVAGRAVNGVLNVLGLGTEGIAQASIVDARPASFTLCMTVDSPMNVRIYYY